MPDTSRSEPCAPASPVDTPQVSDELVTPTERDAVQHALAMALSHFIHLDCSNAAIHCGQMRWSPITFRLAEALDAIGVRGNDVEVVLDHAGKYEEDRGR